MNTQTFKTLPASIAIRRCMEVSDGTFFDVFSDNTKKPISVIHSKGLAVMPLDTKKSGDDNAIVHTIKSDDTKTNIVTFDEAKKHADSTHVAINYNVKFIDIENCIEDFVKSLGKEYKEDIDQFNNSIVSFLNKSKKSDELLDVCMRYARNLANARGIWRNRTISNDIKTNVSCDEFSVSFDSLSIPMNNFDNYLSEEKILGNAIFDCLVGNKQLTFNVEHLLDIGLGSFSVYPSQLFVDDKSSNKNDKSSKYLKVNNNDEVLLNDEKIANAIRTIDNWATELNGKLISVELNGASLKYQKFFRGKNNLNYFLKQLNVLSNTDDIKFVLSCFIRGGVVTSDNKKQK